MKTGVKEGCCFAVVNHALYHLSDDPVSWEAADDALATLSGADWDSVLSWWQTIALKQGDREGWLVCCWAARFGHAPQPKHVAELRLLVHSLYGRSVPDWLYTSM